MYKAKELRRACPRSQAWLVRAFEGGLVASSAARRDGARRSCFAVSRARRAQPHGGSGSSSSARSQLRPLSTSRGALRQEAGRADANANASAAPSTHSPADLEMMETVVRQAKATFGDTLPKGYLSGEEYKMYQRLYGSPLRDTQPDDVGIPFAGQDGGVEATQHTLLRETQGGLLEEVDYEAETAVATQQEQAEGSADETGLAAERPLTDAQVDYIQAVARNEREFNALTKLQRDFEAAALRAAAEEARLEEEEGPEEEEEEIEEENEEEEEDEEDEEDVDGEPGALFGRSEGRLHPLTIAGRSRTNPSTLQLPKADFVEPLTELLKRSDIKHVRLAAQKAFGGRSLPHSPASPQAKGGKGSFPQLPIAMEASHHRMTEIEADAYIAAVLPGVYATAMSTLVEVRKRLGSAWIEGLLSKKDGRNPRILDVGGGGAALAAWNQVFRSDLAVLRERGVLPPAAAESPSTASTGSAESAEPTSESTSSSTPAKRTEKTVVVGSDALRHRISRFLHNTTFLPRLPDLLHSAENVQRHLDAPATPPAAKRKTYDVIIASHLLMPLAKPHLRRALVANLWANLNPDGGVLILLEKGHPRGFEAVADARQRILDDFIVPPPQKSSSAAAAAEETPTDATDAAAADGSAPRPREPGMIIAPCTNHAKCPMYLTPGLSAGRKDFCHFSQRFIRPPFLQRILGESHHNHEDINFSYVAVQRGTQKVKAADPDAAKMEEALRAAAGEADLPAPGPLVQGREATDAAFAGYEDEASSPHPLSLPRTILPPLKRHGHVILDVCTPAGHLERWTVPKSRSRQAYHDARKARWGDLWALGAKTRVARPVRLGKAGSGADGSSDGAKKKRPRVIELAVGSSGQVIGATEKGKGADKGRWKAKSSKKTRARDLLAELTDAELDR